MPPAVNPIAAVIFVVLVAAIAGAGVFAIFKEGVNAPRGEIVMAPAPSCDELRKMLHDTEARGEAAAVAVLACQTCDDQSTDPPARSKKEAVRLELVR